MARLMYLVTDSMACRFLRGQCAYMKSKGFEVTVVASPGPDLDALAASDHVHIEPLSMMREISPLRDLICLLRLWLLMRRVRPDLISAGTAKASLLGMLAGWLARVPLRIYTVRGLRLETTRGLKRRFLRLTEWTTAALSHRAICVSESLRKLYVEFDPAAKGKAVCLGAGSSNGVDAEYFHLTTELREQAVALRQRLGIPTHARVIGFVGRLVRDKGVVELVEAFDIVSRSHGDARLLVLGDFEQGDPLPEPLVQRMKADERIVLCGFVPDPAPYYAVMDLVVLPTYREGFPGVLLEAAAAERPVVAFRATGTVDAVDDQVTGILVAQGDIEALEDAISTYLNDPSLRRTHGMAGRRRVVKHFRPETVWNALYGEYTQLLKRAQVPLPQATHQSTAR